MFLYILLTVRWGKGLGCDALFCLECGRGELFSVVTRRAFLLENLCASGPLLGSRRFEHRP